MTYGNTIYVTKYIDRIITTIVNANKDLKVNFIIKQRPNLQHDLKESMYIDKLFEFNGDIYEFMEEVDITICGISPRGILSMVGTDSIYLGIPTIYFIDRDIELDELGYSGHETIYEFVAKDEKMLAKIFKDMVNNKEQLKLKITKAQEMLITKNAFNNVINKLAEISNE